MDSSSYLQAIQNVAGTTPGEKYKTLNRIAREIIVQSKDRSESTQVQPSSELPEILIPLVKVEIARILQQPDEILEALKSDDDLVFKRALRAKWFFDGTMENVTNVHYFRDRIFNSVSVKNRRILIKILPIHLVAKGRNDIAEEFYATLTNMYGVQLSEPILLACSESFIWNSIMTRKLVLSVRIVEKLINKYPSLIAKYFLLSESISNSNNGSTHHIPLIFYTQFLPRLLKHHPDIFSELVQTRGCWVAQKLSRRGMGKLLKTAANTIIEHAREFAASVHLKLIITNLTKEKFGIFFRNLFPADLESGCRPLRFMQFYGCLRFFPPNEALSLLLTTFENVYKKSLMMYPDLIEPDILVSLPTEQRVNIARIKFEKDPQLIKHQLETSWITYFPISESIPALKSYINKSHDFISGAEHRGQCLEQMIYSCKINHDELALLDVLEYIITRHKNERSDILASVIGTLIHNFRLEELPLQHWKILDNITRMLYVKDKSYFCQNAVQRLIIARIHFNLIRNSSITDQIIFYFNINIHMFREWNILTDNLEYQRKCLDEFLNVASTYSLCSLPSMKLINFINSFITAIYDFNSHKLRADSSIESISIKSYSWLSTKIQELVNSDDKDVEILKSSLKNHHPDLYCEWVKESSMTTEKDELIDISKSNVWKKNPQKILDRWEEYYENGKNKLYRNYTKRFFIDCRWYQVLPIKFAEKCIKEVIEDRRISLILAVLLDGSTFERLTHPYLPPDSTIDFEGENADANYGLAQSIVEVLPNVNPPVSLNLTARYCTVNYIQMAANRLLTLSRRMPIDRFLPFAMDLLDKPVSISKHAIRMCCIAASTEQLTSILVNSWRKNKHYTIRALLIDKMFNLFIRNPCDETWVMMSECLDNLTADDKKASKHLFEVRQISNEYVVAYVKKLFITLRNIQSTQGNDSDSQNIWSEVTTLIEESIAIAVNFPEEFHEEILQTYFADLTVSGKVSRAAITYLLDAYIYSAKDKLDLRLNFFSKIFLDILKNKWDVAYPHNSSTCPANRMIISISDAILTWRADDITRKKFIDVMIKNFLTILNPWQAPIFYLQCKFSSIYSNDMSTREYAVKITNIIPSLIENFSNGFMAEIGKILTRCINCFYLHNSHLVFDLIENLVLLDNEHATILAIRILVDHNRSQYTERRDRIVNILRQQKYPAALAYACMLINSR